MNPALTQAAPIRDLDAARAELRAGFRGVERGRLALAARTHQARLAWMLAGAPGGEFTRWLGGESGEHVPHGTVQEYLRAGEALERGIEVKTLTEAGNAGRKLREMTEAGTPAAQAVEQLQGMAAAGQLRRKPNPKAPPGCTFTALPVAAADLLEELRTELPRLARQYGLEDIPSGAPEQTAWMLEALARQDAQDRAALLSGRPVRVVEVAEIERLKLAAAGHLVAAGLA